MTDAGAFANATAAHHEPLPATDTARGAGPRLVAQPRDVMAKERARLDARLYDVKLFAAR